MANATAGAMLLNTNGTGATASTTMMAATTIQPAPTTAGPSTTQRVASLASTGARSYRASTRTSPKTSQMPTWAATTTAACQLLRRDRLAHGASSTRTTTLTQFGNTAMWGRRARRNALSPTFWCIIIQYSHLARGSSPPCTRTATTTTSWSCLKPLRASRSLSCRRRAIPTYTWTLIRSSPRDIRTRTSKMISAPRSST
mmetsp:Transcript_37759/g.75601  ORF Transcript_37759/g.75601 Transcript_37759/m.75601 type:complete len:200 (-) Transcript_37759:1570-2169(-)